MTWLLVIFAPAVFSGASSDLQTVSFQSEGLCDAAVSAVREEFGEPRTRESAGVKAVCVQVATESNELP
jgi:hypothetical protein